MQHSLHFSAKHLSFVSPIANLRLIPYSNTLHIYNAKKGKKLHFDRRKKCIFFVMA